MQCSHCQHANNETAKFCEECGSKLARACPDCGREVSPHAKLCPECGAGLTASALSPNLRQTDQQQARSSDLTVSLGPTPALRRAPEAERRQLTVLFCDLVDSTALAGRLDPEEWREVVRAYQAACAQVIGRYEGHIAQYLGDGLLVYFGYPQAHEDDAQRAVRTGLGMVAAIRQLNAQFQQNTGVQLAVRVGIHTGLVVVGEIGGSGRQEQLALGDTPNIAARLQGLAAPDTVVLSAATRRLVEPYFTYAELGPQALKGVATPLAVSQVLGESGVQSRLDAAVPRGLTPLVGREQEVGILLERWAHVKDGMGQVVVLSGEAGSGKSRLVQVLQERVSGEGATHMTLRCSPYHTNSALYPVIEHWEQLQQFRRDDTPQDKVAKLAGALAAYRRPPVEVVPLLAGERSSTRSAYLEAVAHLTKGLEELQTLPDTPKRARHEPNLRLALGQALEVNKGPSTPEVEHAYARARELCQQMGDAPQLAAVLVGLAQFYRALGEHQTARELGEQLLTLAQRQHDPKRLSYAHSALGHILFYLGEFVPARAHLEQALASPAAPQDPSFTSLFSGGISLNVLGTPVWVLWVLGYPDQALTRSHEMLTYAQKLQHPFSLAGALFNIMTLHKLRGEAAAAQEWAEAALAVMSEQGIVRYLAATTFTRGWALAAQGQPEEGMAEMRPGLAGRRAMGGGVALAEFPARLAEAYGRIGQVEEGLCLLTEALSLVDRDRWYEAELHRIKGELLLRQAVPDESKAETCFQQAIAVARRQQAKSWELRAAMSLSRLWQLQGKRAEARRLPTEIYGWFTEGFDTVDLQEARALLEALS